LEECQRADEEFSWGLVSDNSIKDALHFTGIRSAEIPCTRN
jgi:hypothetical protein